MRIRFTYPYQPPATGNCYCPGTRIVSDGCTLRQLLATIKDEGFDLFVNCELSQPDRVLKDGDEVLAVKHDDWTNGREPFAVYVNRRRMLPSEHYVIQDGDRVFVCTGVLYTD